MQIVALRSENIKRLHVVEIHPDGSLVVVAGKNDAGKSSVLDSIAMALGGKALVPERPVREGEPEGRISVDLGELRIERVIRPDRTGTLRVLKKDGFAVASPQKILDDLIGNLAFDPLGFTRQSPQEQFATLKALAGLDFTEQDERRAGLYDNRTAVGRDLKSLQAQIAEAPHAEGVPPEEVSISDLVTRLKQAEESVRRREQWEGEQKQLAAEIAFKREQVAELENEIKHLTGKLDEAVGKLKSTTATDPDPIRKELDEAEQRNVHIRANKRRRELIDQEQGAKKAHEALTADIKAIDDEKARAVAAAAMPIEGLALSFADGYVTYKGMPFSQISSSEQIKVSVAMGLAVNPELRVMLVREGSLLDEDSLRLLGELAEKYEAQVWVEWVGEGEQASVVIEDGRVKEEEKR
jgi:DNA repair exonuclease SbcCD ATPase subunit